jgi:hypothetical protein
MFCETSEIGNYSGYLIAKPDQNPVGICEHILMKKNAHDLLAVTVRDIDQHKDQNTTVSWLFQK